MLTRRSLLGSSAVLAAGCSTVGTPVSPSPPSAPQESELNVAAYTRYIHLAGPFGEGALYERPQDKYRQAAATLAKDKENPYGPTRGGYQLALRFVDEFFPSRNQTVSREEGATAEEAASDGAGTAFDEEVALDDFAGVLDDLDADLVTVWPGEARWLGKHGLLLPLDRFSGAEESALNREFYSTVLNEFRRDGALYALPIGATPLMLYYDEKHFAAQGVPPVDVSWDWDDLAKNAAKLTTHRQDGAVARWGLVAHGELVWWALWQNEASLVDLDSLQCRLQEPAAVEALQFVHDLIHKHRVSPVASPRELRDLIWRTPPAMLYNYPPWIRNQTGYRMAALPRGKVHAVPVRAGFGLGIAARTQKTEAAYTALRGFTHAMQDQVVVPASRAAVARLEEIRPDLSTEEVVAVQHSLEHGRGWPHERLQLYAMFNMVAGLGRGDNVATVVNEACSLVHEYKETGKLPLPGD